MKKRLLITLISVLILAPMHVSAQNSLPVQVEISKDKVRIDGDIYYVHLVKQGQTIVSISKAYDIPISEIEARNPSSKNGLKAGTFIYIPTTVGSTAVKEQKNETVREEKYTEPEKKPENTKWTNTNKKKAKKEKSGAGTGYKYRYHGGSSAATSTAAATAAATTTAAATAAATTKSSTSTAKKSAKSNRTEKVTTTVNKEEDEEDIDPDIAYKKNRSEDTTPEELVQSPDYPTSEAGPAPVEPIESISSDLYDTDNSSTTISLILPFGKSARYGTSELNQSDFYAGVLLAMHQLRKDHRFRKYRLEVIDLDKWTSVEEMLSESRIRESALIIGPITPNDAEPVSEFARQNRIPMVSPLDIQTSYLADDNPYLFIYPSSSESVQKKLLQGFSDDIRNETVIIITEKGKSRSPLAVNAFSVLDSLGVKYIDYSYALLQNQHVTSDLKNFIPTESPTPARILVPSEDEAFVADVLRNLNVLVTTENRNLSVFGLPKWRNFGSVQLEYLHHLNTHISLSYYLDYSSKETSDMTTMFETIFHTTPTPFAYQGYDITKFFIESLESYGSRFPVEIADTRNTLIQTDVEFVQKKAGGGFINSAVRNIVYHPDWTVECE